ncbi:Fer1l3 protein [Capsaspora owczarzaki ATCC 30864]|uniref:Fer1l3 protein n=1 Tax=Capsaspora owczarzaki (strain ATCC 30864) TaxID=595528 RepID=A0A0D2X5F6_CAPO3|nr:Fer1l3 protein [Capsaspora owczarzaki ATCC 30864]KJE97724.1 Fer1l3 protein [Capsaspora owczarzaki ATCC 30864]|eukprot:XP_004342902.2 Fer1l3 protein [Capsaspora owczarzaki ATCC 30864]
MPFSLKVTVIQAEDLKNVESTLFNKEAKSDPYCSVTFQEKKQRTEVVEKNLNPQWNQTFDFPLTSALEAGATVLLRVSDYEKVGMNRLLGQVDVQVGFLAKKFEHEAWYSLLDKGNAPTQGRIKVSFKYDDGTGGRKSAAAAAAAASSSSSAAAVADSDADMTDAAGETTAGEEGSDYDVDEAGNPVDPTDPVAAKKRASRARARKRKAGGAKLSTKPADYQIRINIIEARSLPGIGSLDPVVKIACSKQRQQSKVKKSTNHPFYNELFFFNFFESPAKLFDDTIELSVYNARRVRKDAFLGSFKLDIGMIYDEPQHMLQRKWVMLTDPNDRGKGSMGYLKVTILVVGPGDEVPVLDTVVYDADEDIEDNLLRPPGVELEPIDLAVKVYAAEDLPQMDFSFKLGIKKLDKLTGQAGKQNCDPYCVVSFAGKKAKTEVIQNSYFPTFNEELHLPMQIPSMCDKIKLQVMDSDLGIVLNEDDIVGTHFISLTQISSTDPDKGFLPAFGPAWINLYGAPREFETFESDHAELMNKGMESGCAYRGRVLVEITGNPATSELPDPKSPILPADEERVQGFLKRRDYCLRVAFLEGSMIDEDAAKHPIEFEVSMGNVGNKFDVEASNGQQSTTNNETALYDGVHYSYMPWNSKKPCVELNSEWEDVLYRFQSLNRVRFIVRTLNEGIEKASAVLADLIRQSELEAALGTSVMSTGGRADGSGDRRPSRIKHSGVTLEGLAEPSLVSSIVSVCNSLMTAARVPLPALPEGRFTLLDRYVHELREDEKILAAENAQEVRDALSQNLRTPLEAIEALRDIAARLSDTATESQACIPDIIIWMISDKKRKAYVRIPVSDVLFADRVDERGEFFGVARAVTLISPTADPKKKAESVIPARLQLKIWFGAADSEVKWRKHNLGGGQLVVLAESYQNERYLPVKGWSDMLLPVDPPKWSDKAGKEARQPDQVELPPGWSWVGDWFLDPETLDIDTDSGQDVVIEETFENERYYPLKGWGSVMKTDRPTWSDTTGQEELQREKFTLKQGWLWAGEWKVDQNRAVDELGWEYGVTFDNKWHPSKKKVHFVRRRRWIRTRERDPNFDPRTLDRANERSKNLAETGDGWQYAVDFSRKFHNENRTLDTARRRRWRRERILVDGSPAVGPPIKNSFSAGACLSFHESETFQLRAHIYQARDLIGEDKSGLSDPYVRICFGNRSAKSLLIEQNISPTWDQLLVLDDIMLYGTAQEIAASLPEVSIEVFDFDQIGQDDFLGRAFVQPVLRSVHRGLSTSARLQWIPLSRVGEPAGEILAAFEVIPMRETGKNLPLPPKVNVFEALTNKPRQIRRLPDDVRPVMERCRVEVFTWGLRQMKKYRLLTVDSPNVEFECGGISRSTERLRHLSKFPNFAQPFLALEVDLPIEEVYAPPLNVRVYDNRKFGRKPLVGVHSIHSLQRYRRKDNSPQLAIEFVEGAAAGPGAGAIATDEEEVDNDNAPLIGAVAIDVGSSRAASAASVKPVVAGGAGGDVLAPEASVDKSLQVKKPSEEDKPEDSSVDWWTKFFASAASMNAPEPLSDVNAGVLSMDDDPDPSVFAKLKKKMKKTGKKDMDKEHKIAALKKYTGDIVEVYREELEMRFNFNDTLESFALARGKADDGDSEECGQFKGNFRIYPVPRDAPQLDPTELGRWLPWVPSNAQMDVLVRVYIVRGIDLQALDDNGKSDPYCIVSLGGKKNKTIKDRDNYVPATLNPQFGRMYELNATLPMDNELTITVMDWDAVSADDLIGETKIDLERRLLSTCRGTVGLPQTYQTSGINVWRDSQRPTEILKDWCTTMRLREPVYDQNLPYSVTIPGIRNGKFVAKGDQALTKGLAHENGALMALRSLGLVPEHVETRRLINPMQPELEQGKLQMWVDVIPKSLGDIKPPVDISPRKATKYELRAIIWNTKDVIFADVSITGEKMSDIYVKAYMRGLEKDKQRTDVHYRSLNGEGMFNWRCCLPLSYMPAEDVMVIEQKAHFYSLDKETTKVPPLLAIQVWDNDFFKPDDYLGNIDLNLSKMIPFEKNASGCKLGKEYSEGDYISLFEKKRVKGWIPVTRGTKDQLEMTGKVEIEIELLTEEEAAEKPAGQGHSEPNQYPVLEKPKRPATSFIWFLNPWKSFRYIIWKKFKWWIILGLIILFIALFIFIFLYYFPNYSVKKIMGV